MPLNGFSVGRDITLDVNGPTGPIRLNLITGFTRKQDTTDVRVKGLDGSTRHLVFYDGWSGSFDLERQDSVVDDLFSQLESDYYSGLNTPGMTITETITEVDGSVSQYRYTDVVLRLDDAGDWRGENSVKQRIGFMARRRFKVA
jgi:hypothetical protein